MYIANPIYDVVFIYLMKDSPVAKLLIGKIFRQGFGKYTGFGLNLSREIREITGITIRECGEPGKGSRFEIRVSEGKYRILKIDGT